MTAVLLRKSSFLKTTLTSERIDSGVISRCKLRTVSEEFPSECDNTKNMGNKLHSPCSV